MSILPPAIGGMGLYKKTPAATCAWWCTARRQGGLVLQANGRLDACGFVQQGMNATRRCVPVPGWVRPAQGGGLSARYQEALARLCELLRI